MGKLKWFSGGKERSNQAENIITDLLDDLKTDLDNESLKKVLENYLEELKKKGRFCSSDFKSNELRYF